MRSHSGEWGCEALARRFANAFLQGRSHSGEWGCEALARRFALRIFAGAIAWWGMGMRSHSRKCGCDRIFGGAIAWWGMGLRSASALLRASHFWRSDRMVGNGDAIDRMVGNGDAIAY